MTQPISASRPARDFHAGGHAASGMTRLVALLPIHAVVWTIAAWLSRGNLDTQGDMVENYVWGIEWQAGYAKHPPLFAWITAAWFRVFPHTDVAYFALSALNAMVGLLGIAALAGRFVPRRVAVVAGLAMAVTPLYSGLAIKFNANAVLLSVWPWAAYCFVRYMQTGGWRSALALGALAAAAVLGKYFSIVLLVAFALAALVRPAWRARLFHWRSALVVVAGLAVLLPHLHWLVTNHFPTFGYAEQRTGGTLLSAVGRFGIYTLAQIGYLLPAFCFVILIVGEGRLRAAKRMASSYVRPSLHPDLWWLAFAPLIVVGAIAVAARTQMASVWGMAEWFALAPLWLAVLVRERVPVRPERAAWVLVVYWAVVLAVNATIGYSGARRNTDDAAEPRAELAAAAGALWQERTGEPLRIVAGSTQSAQSIAFYGGDGARFWDYGEPRMTPWLGSGDFARDGVLFACRGDDATCATHAAAITGAKPVRVTVSKHAWGMTLPARAYDLFVKAPDNGG
ncbi:glycosyltransferase family 39 protein [Paraburkholderia caballeronis]|uniref:Dolichyl-phosphate-mannose-protein mannosyltransferase n=1 Tax=Paraburkholderia caballeronis TaxID=416943 RepID=A0A1H7VDQ4_9BURK|nr:glycosyltransferase family 39 protein [Paraburkholderia caballeronis]PXW16922.1 dolichyl-phosphate-mannose-protein mannosyltransferase [Paraburkholderia caballeronis]PXW94630.1 dolichyl-phosphate-mannose-protein mannosyltransferase [Paraburkholderia caballeronis]RAJ89979.1 dolichyl-phosphate-mannose-protein mannosyltransferase [Paraburkholderia caballeronis]TDV05026.1 dolichyl-phosphate-mannose-protein mannosyltransferase [Paraburkholderia caballeronis]TDV19159.1 dolichyl-phosphate-mannose-